LIHGRKHLKVTNVCSKAMRKLSAQMSGHINSAISLAIENINENPIKRRKKLM
jgi:hypothetical protein